MCGSDRGYFVFLYDSNGNIDKLAGSVQEMYEDSEYFYGEDEIIKLPRAFMMGSTFQGRVFRTKRPGRPILATIPIGARPLAL